MSCRWSTEESTIKGNQREKQEDLGLVPTLNQTKQSDRRMTESLLLKAAILFSDYAVAFRGYRYYQLFIYYFFPQPCGTQAIEILSYSSHSPPIALPCTGDFI